jgi:hypothetical protein
MSVAAMSARNVVGLLKRFAYAHCDRFFSDVEVRQARHQRARVKFVDLRFELADGGHLPVHAEQIDAFRNLV